MARRWVVSGGAGLLLLACGGCGESGPGLYPAKGRVVYKEAPVAGANVTFFAADGRIATASTNADGQFSLMTGTKPGVALGDYQVGITKLNQMEGMPANPKPEDMAKMMSMKSRSMPKQENALPTKYATPQGSGLTATVTKDASKNEFKFNLEDK